ncbi:HindIII family type II restriction endonuclease, partial [Klebsiella pneumoniae]|nr:HindIII family type II restriction endonuclease [Klebsiella pneumoniae]
STDGIDASKKMANEGVSSERTRMLMMTKDAAVNALIKMHKIDSRIDQINKVTDNNILSLK